MKAKANAHIKIYLYISWAYLIILTSCG